MKQSNFYDVLDLTHDRPKLDGTVIVFGPGNFQDDIRSAVRSGGNKTIILYKRNRNEGLCT